MYQHGEQIVVWQMGKRKAEESSLSLLDPHNDQHRYNHFIIEAEKLPNKHQRAVPPRMLS